MVAGLVKAGCLYIQLDEPSYTGYVDPPTLDRMRAEGQDPLHRLRRAVESENAVIAAHRGRAVVGLHIYRGNRASMWHREGGYDAIAEALLGGLRFDRLLLEYDTERAGGFEPLRFVPKGVVAVLGLITTKTDEVETVDGLRRRLDEARALPAAGSAGPQPAMRLRLQHCRQRAERGGAMRKLDVMLETARRVWG